jgi:hypothetical protein
MESKHVFFLITVCYKIGCNRTPYAVVVHMYGVPRSLSIRNNNRTSSDFVYLYDIHVISSVKTIFEFVCIPIATNTRRSQFNLVLVLPQYYIYSLQQMLALKKKREAEQKAAAEAAAAAVTVADTTTTQHTVTDVNDNQTPKQQQQQQQTIDGESNTTTNATTDNNNTNTKAKISLLGIGGMKKKDNTSSNSSNNTAHKKRTPGEIRIQKGMSSLLDRLFVCLNMCVFVVKVRFLFPLVVSTHHYSPCPRHSF